MKNNSATAVISVKLKKGRTVRDIVEQDPGQVSEVWCRKIYRHLLSALERQYALHLPHRPITPETVVLDGDGKPHLLAAMGDPAPEVAQDLTALARLIHYAITREPVPTAPLHGRALGHYSSSLISAVDRSMAARQADRPCTIEQLRDILGIVVVGRPFADAARPERVPVQTPALARLLRRCPSSLQVPERMRLAVPVAGAIAVVLGGLWVVFVGNSEPPSFEQLALTMPRTVAVRQAPGWASTSTAARGDGGVVIEPVRPSPEPLVALPEITATEMQSASVNARATTGRARASAPVPNRTGHDRAASGNLTAPSVAAPVAATSPSTTSPAQHEDFAGPPTHAEQRVSTQAPTPVKGAVLNLQIAPWGVVYLDGVIRGVSPPLKRLVVAPGHHSIQVANPNQAKRLFDIDVSDGENLVTVDFTDSSR